MFNFRRKPYLLHKMGANSEEMLKYQKTVSNQHKTDRWPKELIEGCVRNIGKFGNVYMCNNDDIKQKLDSLNLITKLGFR